MTRIIHVSALSLIGAGWLSMAACASSNAPATVGGAGAPPTSMAGAAPVSGAGAPSAGAPTTDGGAPAAGGATGSGGAPPAGGGAPPAGGEFTPLCATLTTAAGVAPTKGGACTATDSQLCYKTCGPKNVGFKSETCTSGVYLEQSNCVFPSTLDASCFKIPATPDPTCPTEIPQASQMCAVADCTPCSVGGQYYDSAAIPGTSTPKIGYCVCVANAAGMSKWSCATAATAWPCPQGKGCL